LERIFKNQSFSFEIQGDIVVVKPAFQKSVEPEKKKMRTIKGQVTDENGEPIPGANIWLKGTTTGTPSDMITRLPLMRSIAWLWLLSWDINRSR
jgi:hypothetical protein